MKLTVGMANTVIGINLFGEAERALSLCLEYLKGFICPDRKADAAIKITILKHPGKAIPINKTGRKRVVEQRLSTEDVKKWLETIPGYRNDFPMTETTISSYCLGGLLLFNPETSDGCILLREGPRCLQPTYRLLWMYLAQVLGERKGCFIHSAALARDGKGYLFLGESGAGKSTLARLYGGSSVFSDDCPVLCKCQDAYLVFPSPYRQTGLLEGSDRYATGTSAKLEGFYFLCKDDRTYLEDISKQEAISLIINRHLFFFQYLSSRSRSHLFGFFCDLCDKMTPYKLHFCLDEDIWGAIDSSRRRLT
jgi:hypothetical protein